MVHPGNMRKNLETAFIVPISTWLLAAGRCHYPLEIHKVEVLMLVFQELSQGYSFKMVLSPVINSISMEWATSAQVHSSAIEGCKPLSFWIREIHSTSSEIMLLRSKPHKIFCMGKVGTKNKCKKHVSRFVSDIQALVASPCV